MYSCSLVFICFLYAIYFVYNIPQQEKAGDIFKLSDKFKAEYYKNLINLEKRHKTAFSHNPEQCETWIEVQKVLNSACKWLIQKIFPRKNLSNIIGGTTKLNLIYRRVRGQDNKPFPTIEITSLLCKFPKRNCKRTWINFIKSPDPTCAFFLNRLGSRSTTFYIAEEICKWKTYPRFWKIVPLGKETMWNPSTRCERREPLCADTKEEQECCEREHRKDYLQKPNMYQTWPELDQMDEKVYCYTLLQNFFPGTGIDIRDVKSKRGLIMLFYRRIKDEIYDDHANWQVNALTCNISPKGCNKNCYILIRAAKPKCILLVKKKHPTIGIYYICRQYCEDEESINLFVSKVEMEPVEKVEGNSSRERTTDIN